MVRGRLTVCVALAIAVFTAGPAAAQPHYRYRAFHPPRSSRSRPTRSSRPRPPVPARTAYQPGPQDDPNVTLPGGTLIPIPQGKPRRFSWTPRYGTRPTIESVKLPDGTERQPLHRRLDLQRHHRRRRGNRTRHRQRRPVAPRASTTSTPEGFQTGGDGKAEVEFYLAGNVIVRTKSDKSPLQVLRATEVYYDVERERAIALAGDLEFTPRFARTPSTCAGARVRRLDAENWEVLDASFDSSKLPSDPGLRIDSDRVTYNERQVQLRNVFGIPYRDLLTGEPVYGRRAAR